MVSVVTDYNDFCNQLLVAEQKQKLAVVRWTLIVQTLIDAMEDVVFIQVDVEDLDHVSNKFKITAMPTFISFKDGDKVAGLQGANEENLKELVEVHKAM